MKEETFQASFATHGMLVCTYGYITSNYDISVAAKSMSRRSKRERGV